MDIRKRILGDSAPIREVIALIEKVAPLDIAILISGESGTGKEVVAKAIYENSRRKAEPFVIVNSGAIPEGILESELFGHVKGAFTGAVGDRKGYFEQADGGTVFLDEIGETPLSTQVKLLRVLENGEYYRVGSSQVQRTNVRIIAATNQNLERMVKERRFRKDLFYRLKSVSIRLPALRERKADIPLLAGTFADEVAKKYGFVFHGFSDSAVQTLRQYKWPGNIRELKNLVQSIVVLNKGEEITAEDVLINLKNYQSLDDLTTPEEDAHLPVPLNMPSDKAERELIYKTLLLINQNVTELRELVLRGLLNQENLKDLYGEVNQMERSLGGLGTSQFSGKGKAEDDADVVDVDSGKLIETEYHVDEPEKERSLSLKQNEINLIRAALKQFKGSKRKAAKALSISERTLYRKLKEYAIET